MRHYPQPGGSDRVALSPERWLKKTRNLGSQVPEQWPILLQIIHLEITSNRDRHKLLRAVLIFLI